MEFLKPLMVGDVDFYSWMLKCGNTRIIKHDNIGRPGYFFLKYI